MKQLTPACDLGLGAFHVADLCHPGRLVESVIEKVHQLPTGYFAHERLERDIRLILSILRDAVCGEYRSLPLTTLADFLQALHYFLKWKDRRPDTWQGGYLDDLEEVVRVMRLHASVVKDYQRWKTARLCVMNPGAPPSDPPLAVQEIEIEFMAAEQGEDAGPEGEPDGVRGSFAV